MTDQSNVSNRSEDGATEDDTQFGSTEVHRLARLSRLELAEEEALSFGGDLQSLFGKFKQLQAVDTSEVKPLCHVHGESNRFREDKAVESPYREQILKQAPDTSGTFLRVPLVIDQIDNP